MEGYLNAIQSGDVEKKARAAGTIFSLSADDESRKEILELNGVKLLVGLLDSNNVNILRNSAGALLNLANDEECRVEIREHGGVQKLMKLIEEAPTKVKEYAAGCMVNLANDPETREIVKSKKVDGVNILHKLLSSDNDELKRCAVGSFGTLVIDSDICAQLREIDEFKGVIECLKHDDDDIRQRASGCLWNISCDSDTSRITLAKSGAIHVLADLLEEDDPELLSNVSMCISILASTDSNAKLIRTLECIPKIVSLLGHSDNRVQQNAVAACWNLAHIPENKEILYKSGAVKGIVKLLESKDDDTIWKTLGALVTMGGHEPTSIKFRELGGLKRLIPLINVQELSAKDRKNPTKIKIVTYATIALAVLAYEDGNKDAIREEGGLSHLIDMLEPDQNETHIEKACAALLNLTLNAKNRTVIRQLDGIAPLIQLLFHKNPAIQQNAAGCLWNLSNDPKNKTVIRELGGLNALLTLISGGKLDPRQKPPARPPKQIDYMSDEDDSDEDPYKEDVQHDGRVRDTFCGFGEYGKEMRKRGQVVVGAPRFSLKERKKKLAREAKRRAIEEQEEKERLERQRRLEELERQRKKKEEEERKRREEEERKKRLERERQRKLKEEQERKERERRAAERKKREAEERERRKREEEERRKLEAKKKAEEERKRKEEEEARRKAIITRAEAKNDLENYAHRLRKRIVDDEDLGAVLTPDEKKTIDDKAKEILEWLEKNPNATQKEIEEKMKELQNKAQPIVSRAEQRLDLENYAHRLKKRIDDEDLDLTPEEKKTIEKAAQEALDFLKKNPNATSKQIADQLKKLQDKAQPIITRAEARNQLQNYAHNLRKRIVDDEELGNVLTPEEKKAINEETQAVLDYLADHPNADQKEIENQRRNLENRVDPIIDRGEQKLDLGKLARDLRKRINEDEQLAKRLSPDEKKRIEGAIKEALDWLDKNPNAKGTEIQEKRKEFEEKVNPIISKAEAQNDLENYARGIRDRIQNDDVLAQNLSPQEKKTLDTQTTEALDWLAKNPNAKTEEVEKKKKDLQEKVEPILSKAERRKDLFNYAHQLRNRIRDDPQLADRLSNDEKKRINADIQETLDWLKNNKDASADKLKDKKRELERKVEPVLDRAKAFNDLANHAHRLKKRVEDDDLLASNLTPQEQQKIQSKAKDVLEWLKDNPNASKSAIDEKKQDLIDTTQPIIDRAEQKADLDNYIYNVRNRLANDDELAKRLSPEDGKKINEETQEALDWLADNQDASLGELKNKKKKLKESIQPVLDRADAFNNLHDYAHRNLRRLKEDDTLAKSLKPNEKKLIEDKTKEVLDFLDKHPDATKGQLDARHKNLENEIDPIISKAEQRSDLEKYLNNVKRRINDIDDLGSVLTPEEKRKIEKEAKDANDWLQKNKDASANEIKKKRDEVHNKIDPIIDRANAKNQLEKYARNVRNKIEEDDELSKALTSEEKKKIDKETKEAIDWLKKNPQATKAQIEERHDELKDKIHPILSRAETKIDLEKFAHGIRDRVKRDAELARTLNDKEKKIIDIETQRVLDFLDKRPDAPIEELHDKKQELSDSVNPIISRADAYNKLDNFANRIRRRIEEDEELAKVLTPEETQTLNSQTSDALNWLNKNRDAKKTDIETKQRKLHEQVNPIIQRAEQRLDLSNYANNLRRRVKEDDELARRLTKDEKKQINDETTEALDWLDKNKDATTSQIKAKKSQLEDNLDPLVRRADAFNDLDNYARGLRRRLKDDQQLAQQLSPNEKKIINDEAQQVIDWLEKNPKCTESEIQAKKQDLEDKVDPIVKKAEARLDLCNYANNIRKRIKEDPTLAKLLSNDDKRRIDDAAKEAIEWLDKNKNAPISAIQEKKEDLERIVEPIIKRVEARNNLQAFAHQLRNRLKDANMLSNDDKNRIMDETQKVLDWLDAHPNASEPEIRAKYDALRDTIEPIFDAKRLKEQEKLANLAHNILHSLHTNKKLQGSLTDDQKQALDDYAHEALAWLEKNPNASAADIESHQRWLYERIGGITQFKFSVWRVKAYGLGYGLEEHLKWGDRSRLYKDSKQYVKAERKDGPREKKYKVGINKKYNRWGGKIGEKEPPTKKKSDTIWGDRLKFDNKLSPEDEEALLKLEQIKSKMINPFMQANMNSLKVDPSGRVPESTTTSALQEAPVEIKEGQTFTYEQLKHKPGRSFPVGIDVAAREKYLSDEEFKKVLKMTKAEFAKLPAWRQQKLKKDVGLF